MHITSEFAEHAACYTVTVTYPPIVDTSLSDVETITVYMNANGKWTATIRVTSTFVFADYSNLRSYAATNQGV